MNYNSVENDSYIWYSVSHIDSDTVKTLAVNYFFLDIFILCSDKK